MLSQTKNHDSKVSLQSPLNIKPDVIPMTPSEINLKKAANILVIQNTAAKRNASEFDEAVSHQNMFSFGNIEPSFYAEQEVVKCTLAEPESPPVMSQMDPNLTVRFGGYGTKATGASEPRFASVDGLNNSQECGQPKTNFDSVEINTAPSRLKTIKSS